MKKIFFFLALVSSVVFANTLDEIKSKGVVRIGVFADQAPFSQLVDGKFEGFEIDFANKIAAKIFGDKGGSVQFIQTQGNQRIEMLQNNELDLVLATLTVTKERSALIDFSMPYFAVNIGVLTRANDNISKIADLNEKTILVEKGTTGEAYFKQNGYNIKQCDNSGDCYRKLKSDSTVSGFANDNLIVLAYPVVDTSVEVNIKNIGTSDFLGIAVKKGNKELLNFINQQLIDLSKSGFFKESFTNFIEPYYKGTADRKYFLLDDIYKMF